MSKGRKRRLLTFIIVLSVMGIFSLLFFKTSFTISKVIEKLNDVNSLPVAKDLPQLPKDDPNRIDILLLGGRGWDDPGDGKLLSDTMLVISIKKGAEGQINQVALISVPRDLYVRLWCTEESKKINFAYAHGGLSCAKKTVSLATGLYIDHAVNVNFEALEETVDVLGGIDIHLDEPFEEIFQWAKDGQEENDYWFIKDFDGEERWVFHVPEGDNHLDGTTALYFVRSRYSTDDFDRMRRQQQVIMALKNKALSIGVLANPVKIYNLLDILGENIRTDAGLGTIRELIELASDVDTENIKTKIFDTTPAGLLYHTFIDEEYVLLPTGDNFDQIHETCINIFD